MPFYLTRRRRLDAILDAAEAAGDKAHQRAREAGHDEHTIAYESLDAYHQRRHELRTAQKVADAELLQRADERDGTDPAELLERDRHLAALAAAREQAEFELEQAIDTEIELDR